MSNQQKPRDAAWQATIARLDKAYRAGGRAALEQMQGVEPLALANDKVRDYKLLGRILAEQPENQAAQQQQALLLREINDIGGWIKGKLREYDRLPMPARPPSGESARQPAQAKQPLAKTRTLDLEMG